MAEVDPVILQLRKDVQAYLQVVRALNAASAARALSLPQSIGGSRRNVTKS